jgi:N-acetylglucosamine kinase-like BadF-type ATPase
VLVGVDIGGIKTHVRVVGDDSPARDSVVPSESWIVGMLASDPDNADRLVRLLPAEALTAGSALVVGAHGLDSPAQVANFNRWLADAFPGVTLAVNDVALLAPAAGLGEAVCVVAGTGSKVVGHREDGSIVEAGGHGFLIGDPGSAPSLARDAMKSLLVAYDDGLPLDGLAEAMIAVHGHRDLPELWISMFIEDPSLTLWGSLAPAVFAAAEAGDGRALAVIDDHASQMAADVHRVIRRGALGDVVVCAGGVITRQRLLRDALWRHIDALDLGLSMRTLDVPPVAGAVALAQRLRDESVRTA